MCMGVPNGENWSCIYLNCVAYFRYVVCMYEQRLITKEEDLSQVRSFEYQIHTGTHSLSDMGMFEGDTSVS